MNEKVHFVDILELRRAQAGIFCYMTRNWNPRKTLDMDKQYTPQELKDFVSNSVYLDSVMEAECARSGVSKEKLHEEVVSYLEEMGTDQKVYIIRWMGIVFLKISLMMKIKLFVNEPPVLKLKSTLGTNPVLFLPTHRSYADFCLMTYLCYHYDIDFPAVAAGMDFYSMAVLGKCMRETGAFYMRRTLAGAPLYAATLRQYVRTLVSKHCSPIEFFLEGTRSRSNKSLPPKYGMLSMSLVPYFAREVSDVTIVPVNISYDRLMEHGLFAYEHLGVPKPKESTGGFLKALRSLNDHFGNIYINVGTPLSLRDYLQDYMPTNKESLKPIDLQQLTPEQFKQVQDVADHVISLQQKNTVATISNLLSLVLMQSLIKDQALTFEEVVEEVGWMVQVLKNLGASVFENDVKGSVERTLVVHGQMIRVERDRRLRLVAGPAMEMPSDVKDKMKGHILDAETMALAIPVIQLQLYVNPMLHYLVPPALICLIVQKGNVTLDDLRTDYYRLRKLLSHEFFYLEKAEESTFNTALEYCERYRVILNSGDSYSLGGEGKLQYLLKWSVWPALTTLKMCAEVMTEQVMCEQKQALKRIQQRIESSQCHPYCLSLEATTNCLQGLTAAGALVKDKQQDVIYNLVPKVMEQCHHLLSVTLPTFNVNFGRSNSVIFDERGLAKL